MQFGRAVYIDGHVQRWVQDFMKGHVGDMTMATGLAAPHLPAAAPCIGFGRLCHGNSNEELKSPEM